MPALRAARMLQASEPAYRDAVRAIEDDPLYQRLSRGPLGVFRRAARPARFCRAALEPAALSSSFDSVPEEAPEFYKLIRSLGPERFARYFLGEEEHEDAAAARALGLAPEDVRRIRAFVDRFFAAAGSAPSTAPLAVPSYPVASLSREDGRLEVRYLSAHYARGRYRIDYDAIAALRRAGAFTREEAARLRGMVGAMEALNAKLTALDAALSAAARGQSAYLLSGDRSLLRPLTQREAAASAGISSSAFCRALSGRSVLTPWGQTAALPDLFPSRREQVGRLVEEVLQEGPATDEAVRRRLLERGVRVSRRLVNLRRRERAR
ncbi:MAG TPA: hypothetical protein DCM05_01000 [Elusimicrobia bacterium]|nr:hypothetical protein [Elusimicrobiota bacterium]